MGSLVAGRFASGPPDASMIRTMLTAAPHLGQSHTVKTHGSCVLGISNGTDYIDATISNRSDWSGIFLGHLDNTEELSKSLGVLADPRPSPADLAVEAFRAFGADAPAYLRGVFAAVVTNGHDLWFCRDHLGFRALFYKDFGRKFLIASEAKQIVAGAGMTREPDLDVLTRILYGTGSPETPSAIKGIERLPQCTVIAVNSSGTSRPYRYWKPENVLETSRLRPDEIGERFSEVFTRAVCRTLTGHDAISLSGGIDSPAVAAYAAPLHLKMTGRPIGAVSQVFPHLKEVDESAYIELISGYLGIDLHTYVSKARLWDKDLVYWCQLFDGPVPTLAFSEMREFYQVAYQHGYRNILTGDIAELVFDLGRHVLGHLATQGRWRPVFNLVRTLRGQGSSWRTIAGLLTAPLVPGEIANAYLQLRGLDFPTRIPDWMESRKVNEVPFRRDLVPSGWKRWSTLQLEPTRTGYSITLEACDICAGLSGVRVRRPFADIDVWEFFLSLPAEIKYPDLKSKTLMRRLLRGRLPDQILDRRSKTVFDAHLMARIDYEPLRQFLANPQYRLPGIDYRRLAQRIERRDLQMIDCFWLNDLVRIHAFLSQWEAPVRNPVHSMAGSS